MSSKKSALNEECAQRLDDAMIARRYDAVVLGSKMNYQADTIRKIRRGELPMTRRFAAAAAPALGVTAEWLLKGEGEAPVLEPTQPDANISSAENDEPMGADTLLVGRQAVVIVINTTISYQCPSCREIVQQGARMCPHCRCILGWPKIVKS